MKTKIVLVLGVFFVSFAAIFVKLVDIAPSVIAMYRLGIGGLLLLPFAIKNQELKKTTFKDFKLIILSALMISLHYLAWFTSLKYTSVTSSTLIICTEPLVALILGFALYREKVSIKQLSLLLIALLGVLIVAWGDFSISIEAATGDLLTFVAVIFFVIYLFIGQNIVKRYSFITYTSLLFIFASLILLIYNLIFGYELINYQLSDWLIILLIAIIPNAGQVIFNYLLQFVKSSLIATAILLEPIFATILAVIILKDQVFLNHYLGGIIIIASVYIYIKYEKIKS